MSWVSQAIKKVRKGKVGRWFDTHMDDVGAGVGFVAGTFAGNPVAGAAIGRAALGQIGPEHDFKLKTLAKQAGIGAIQGYGAKSLGADRLVARGAGKLGMSNPSIAKLLQTGGKALPEVGSSAIPNLEPHMAGAPRDMMYRPHQAGRIVADPRMAPVNPSFRGIDQIAGRATPGALPNAGNAARSINPSSYVKRGMDWLTDPERGLQRTVLATQGLGAAANAYGAYQEGRIYDQEREEARENREAQAQMLAPHIERLSKMLEKRMLARGL